MSPLAVLLVESHPGNATREAVALERAGHNVHRCHEPDANGFPCTELTSPGSCPLETGVDVVLAVRRVAPHPTDLEQGVSCALRAGIPVIEDGPTILDPFEPYLSGRVTGDVVTACEDAADGGWEPLRQAILDRTERLLAGADIARDDVDISFQREGTTLRIELSGAPVTASIRQALGVRVLDALRTSARTFGQVDVGYVDAAADLI